MNRSQTDLLRILSAVAIVFNHTLWESFIQFPSTTESIFVALINQAGKGAVLFFIYLSGFAFSRHPHLQNPFPWQRFYRSRLGRIGPLYLLSSLIFYFWKNPIGSLPEVLLLGSAHFHLYFLALILYLYLLFPLLRQLPSSGPLTIIFFIMILVLLAMGFFLEGETTAVYGWFLYAGYGLFFFQLGIWGGQGKFSVPARFAPLLLLFSFALLWVDFVIRADSGMPVDHAGRVWRPSVALFTLAAMAMIRRVPLWDTDLKQPARATFLVYVIHPFFMEGVSTWEPGIRFVLVLLTSFAAAWLLSSLGRRFRFIGLIFGEGDHLLAERNLQGGPDKKQ